MIEIIKVTDKKKLRQFINFPHELYREEPNYVSDLNLTIKSKLTKKNPFLSHSEIVLFIAKETETGKISGRIAAIYNKTHLKKYKDNYGFFGFFDSINEIEVSNRLFDKVEKWLKSKGIDYIVGPTNLTTNDSCGVLVKGFKYPNQVSMPYNYSYYSNLIESQGFVKEIDLKAYHLKGEADLGKFSSIMQRVELRLTKNGIKIRQLKAKSFNKDIKSLRTAYNFFNDNSWGFIPLNEEEFNHMAKELKSIMPYELALIAEIDNEIIGYIIAVPDFNQVLKKIRNGKLFPSGIFKILRYRRKIDSSRVMLIGINKKFRGTGLDLLLYQKITDALHKQNIYQCEAGYVMSTNKTMNSLMLKMGGNPIKTYRLYKKAI